MPTTFPVDFCVILSTAVCNVDVARAVKIVGLIQGQELPLPKMEGYRELQPKRLSHRCENILAIVPITQTSFPLSFVCCDEPLSMQTQLQRLEVVPEDSLANETKEHILRVLMMKFAESHQWDSRSVGRMLFAVAHEFEGHGTWSVHACGTCEWTKQTCVWTAAMSDWVTFASSLDPRFSAGQLRAAVVEWVCYHTASNVIWTTNECHFDHWEVTQMSLVRN